MAETREITLEVSEAEVTLLDDFLNYAASQTVHNQELLALKVKIELAWAEGMTDEDIALKHYAPERWAGAGGK